MPKTKFLFSFLTQLRQLEVTRQLKGQAVLSSALATSRSETEEWPGAPGTGSDFMAPGTARLSPFGPGPSYLEPPEMNRKALILSGAAKAVFLLQRRCPGLDGNKRLCSSIRTAINLDGFEKQTLTKPSQCCPSCLLFSTTHRPLPSLQTYWMDHAKISS